MQQAFIQCLMLVCILCNEQEPDVNRKLNILFSSNETLLSFNVTNRKLENYQEYL